MHSSISGVIDKVGKVTNAVATAIGVPTMPVEKTGSFRNNKFPTSIRYLYLKSKKDSMKVVTVGYYFETPEVVCYQTASVKREKWDWGCRDIFSREIAREIVNGRIEKYPCKRIKVENKEEMYNTFIYLYHPDRSEKRKAKKALLLSQFASTQPVVNEDK